MVVERKMSAKEVVNLINDPAAFNSFATEVNTKLEAAKAEKLHPQPILEEKPAVTQEAAPVTVVGNAMAANQPSMQLGGERVLEGKIATSELKRA
jgi:hypothetical protein